MKDYFKQYIIRNQHDGNKIEIDRRTIYSGSGEGEVASEVLSTTSLALIVTFLI